MPVTLPHSQARRLSVILAWRMSLVAAVVSLVLLGGFFAKYFLDTNFLRRRTLRADIDRIALTLAAGQDPTRLAPYVAYPGSYAFRVFDRRLADLRKVVSQVNPALLPPLEVPQPGSNAERALHLAQSFGPLDRPDQADGGRPQTWMMTDRVHVGDHHYWVQVLMVGDPAGRWLTVIGNEMLDHVGIPVLTIVPALTLAMIIAISASLRPLGRIAREAETISASVAAGRPLAPLPVDNLPREIADVVAAINITLRELEHALLMQRQFTSDVSHELRTPLAILLLETAELANGPQRQRITAELESLSALVGELLRFAEAEEALVAVRQEVDLAALARGVCTELAPRALAARLLVEFDCPPLPVMISGSATLVELAIRNLLDNAIKLSPAGEAVSVSVSAAGVLRIDDRGPGVPAEQRERVFDRFWRGEPSRPGGSGIGLALVRRVAQLHEASVHVEARPGGGARFVLAFPLVSVRAELVALT
ncbi:MAG: HAMP domain-containing histidine kinase [Rhodospirillales bacterium]|nr:HAMP domain-containing histidine kinase [Rhodospirillales bacterium]MDE2198086.1 HAMP domain-containing histidine kinase [Rhodospirillales bacterium]MDE2573911.1 HAMP domain-containing histidine kinase [Rhodospirillales bacterium]